MILCNKIDIRYKDEVLVDFGFTLHSSTALVGQSGSGKSLSLKAILGMLPSSLSANLDIQSEVPLVRGESVGFVPQNAFTALSPMTKIKNQWLGDLDEARRLFALVGLDVELLERFPAELSGGQLQRVIIAIALSTRPYLLLLDEPTTALDPFLREEIIEILVQLRKEIGFLMLFVTHDMTIARRLCDEIVVLKEGYCVESGTSETIFMHPKEMYTKNLIEASFSQREFRK